MALENMFQENLEEKVKEFKAAKTEADRDRLIRKMADDIAKLAKSQKNDVSVNNLDEITAALRNELARALKPVRDSVPNSMKGIEKELQDVGSLSLMRTVEGLPKFMTAMLVKFLDFQTSNRERDRANLESLTKELMDELVPEIQNSINLQVSPTPIDVKPADVNIDLGQVVAAINALKIPEVNDVDLNGILRALAPLEFLSDSPQSPLSVRLSDGQNFIRIMTELKNLLKDINKGQRDVKAVVGGGTTIQGIARMRESGYSVIGDGRQTVTTAGTRVQLSTTSVSCNKVLITGETDNTGTVVVGSSSVVAALATRRGTPLEAYQGIMLEVDNLNKVYLDSTVNGEGVTYVYYA